MLNIWIRKRTEFQILSSIEEKTKQKVQKRKRRKQKRKMQKENV